jgi:hypothetical protein
MTIIAGKKAGFWGAHQEAVSISVDGAPMTQVGSSLEYYVTDRTMAMWDPNQPVVVYDGVTEIVPSRIDYAGGYVTLQAAPSGALTTDFYYLPIEALGGAYGVKADLKADTKDITTFSGTLNSAVAWKEFVATLKGWSMSVQRHFFYAKASLTTAIGTANAELKWEWNDPGLGGHAEAIEYVAGGSLSVVRAANVTTVTYVAATTTAAQVKTAVETDPTLSALWTLSYPAGNDGSGKVGAVAHTHLSGGRDSTEISKLGTKVLCVMYLDIMTGTVAKLEGVGVMSGLSPDCKLEALVESDVTFEGTGALRLHTV